MSWAGGQTGANKSRGSGATHGVLLEMILDESLARLRAAQAGELFLALEGGAKVVRVGVCLDGDGADVLFVARLPLVAPLDDRALRAASAALSGCESAAGAHVVELVGRVSADEGCAGVGGLAEDGVGGVGRGFGG